MTDRELMQQALEALDLHAKQYPHMVKGYTADAASALRERLAQPEQERPTFADWTSDYVQDNLHKLNPEQEIDWKDQYEKQKRRAEMWRDKYEAVAGPDECVYPAQPEQEPVACPYCKSSATLGAVYYDQNCVGCVKRMTSSPQRKPLTDEQREEVAKGWRGRNWTVGDIIDATEAAHGIMKGGAA